MKKTDAERLKKIVSTWEALEKEIRDRSITKDRVLTDPFFQWAVTTPLYNIGEQVYQLSPEFKKEHDDIEWRMVSGLRHRLVHDYEGVNWNIIAGVLFEDMDEFVRAIEILIKEDAPSK